MTDLEVKTAVRERDGQRCTKCGMTAAKHKELFGRTLEVHRVQPGSRYSVDGCVTLCKPCHQPEPKSPKRTFANGFATVLIPAEWHRIISTLAKSRGMRMNDYLISSIMKEAERLRDIMGVKLPMPPWEKRLTKSR